MARKKLLVLTSTFPRWDGDNEPPFVFELCRRLKQHFDITVLAPHAPDASLHETLDGMSVRRFRYFFSRWETLAYQGGIMAKLKRNVGYHLLVPFFLVGQLIALLRLVRNEKIDAIHAHWLIPQGLSVAAGRSVIGAHFPVVLCTSHGTDLLGLNGLFLCMLKRFVMKKSDKLTVVSQSMMPHALTLHPCEEKLSVIPMGIDAIRHFTPPVSGERIATELLFVGRLVESKAVDVLLRAMPAILTRKHEVALRIVGDGPEMNRLVALAQTLGIAEKVHFLGAIPNHALPRLYRRAGIFISPSRSEGFGLTVAEAQACECAVVASDLPATREIVIDGKTGLTFPPGDVTALTEKILALLDDPDQCRDLGQVGRICILQSAEWETVAANYASLIHQLIMHSTS